MVSKFLTPLRQKKPVNYPYFLLLFALLFTFHLFHYTTSDTPLLFLLSSIGQALLEVVTLALIAHLLSLFKKGWIAPLWISLSFFLLLYHFTDFTLLRLMDTSIAYLFTFFGSEWTHWATAFQALHLNGLMILLSLGATLLVPFLGLLLYKATWPLARLKPLSASPAELFSLLFTSSACLLLVDGSSPFLLTREAYSRHQKSLPFGATLFSPPPHSLSLATPLSPLREEATLHAHLPTTPLAKRPNIYLFIVETLRRDFFTESTAPHLTSLQPLFLPFEESFSNASATHPSWYAILHANVPYHWTAARDTWREGSVPLHALKRLGYQIHVYSSTDLSYFGMDLLLFGEQKQLLTSLKTTFQEKHLATWEQDLLTLSLFERDLDPSERSEGHCHIFFLESTHSEYSFPSPPLFTPICEKIDYLTLHPSEEELAPIKNRYRNAIHAIDALLGKFWNILEEKGLSRDAIWAVTGDHGEEFFEEGALFHGTHLNRYQTAVPLLLHLPGPTPPLQTREATHLDLLPTILHYLTGESDLSPLCDGESVFAEKRRPYRIAVLHNGPNTPGEFTLEKGPFRAHFRLFDPAKIYEATAIELLSSSSREEAAQALSSFLSSPAGD